MNKKEILDILYSYHFDPNKYIVITGAAMVIQGFKDTTNDIDIALSSDYYNYLLTNYDCKLEDGKTGVYYLDKVINFGANYYNENEKIMIDGIPCQNTDGIIKLKKQLNRDKDLRDMALIDRKINANSLVLAYLGDAIYEIYVRRYLINKGITSVNDLQKEAVKYVSAKNQASYLTELMDSNFFTKEELDIIYRARNHKSHPSKSTTIATYKYSTGFEALIGYLDITNNKPRIDEIMHYILKEE